MPEESRNSKFRQSWASISSTEVQPRLRISCSKVVCWLFLLPPHSRTCQMCIRDSSWGVVYVLLLRTSPRPFHRWRVFLLRCFGAKLGKNCHIYGRARVWAPWNLICNDRRSGTRRSSTTRNPLCWAITRLFLSRLISAGPLSTMRIQHFPS